MFTALSTMTGNIDIPCPIPIWRRFYVNLMIGPERRSKERHQKERENHPLLIFANIVLMTVVVTMVGLLLTLHGDSVTNVLQDGWFLVLQQVSAIQHFIGTLPGIPVVYM